MNIVFRADASINIGFGHVMRCLALADKLSEVGASVCFICRESSGNLIDYLRQKEIRVIGIPVGEKEKKSSEDHNDNWESDAKVVKDILKEIGAVQWIVVDHYSLDDKWESCLRPYVSGIMVIDDLANRKHDCDILLDQNYYYEQNRYKELVPNHCRLLLGPKYALLRDSFSNKRQQSTGYKGKIHNILVFFGGTDSNNETGKALEAIRLLNKQDLHIEVIIGESNPNQNELNEIVDQLPGAKLNIQVENIHDYFDKADLAIGAGGSTTWERCCLGLPSLVVTIAENQINVSRDVALKGAHIWLGNSEQVSAHCIANHIESLLTSPCLVSHISSIAKDLVDGKGTQRVVEEIKSPDIVLRLASEEDCKSLFRWRNSDSVRINSFDTCLISWDQHVRWFNATLADKCKYILIAEIKDTAIGVLRYDCEAEKADVSIYMVPEMIGKRLGTALLKAGNIWLNRYLPNIKTVESKVQFFNKASQQIFLKAGFIESYNVYRYGLSQTIS
jgi:UDP-2,4-diacetamido-2,4,6-trideoxy-beta-L-altropyranose hydrolase